MQNYSNGSSIKFDNDISWFDMGFVADLIGSLNGGRNIHHQEERWQHQLDPIVSLIVERTTGQHISLEIHRSGPVHSEITMKIGDEYNHELNPGDWIRTIRALASYLLSKRSESDLLHWIELIEERYTVARKSPYND